MKVKYKVFSNLYQDSVSLMQISAQISKLPGIQQASVVMGTPNNLEQLRDAGLGNEINASPNIQVARLWQHQGDSDTFAHTTE